MTAYGSYPKTKYMVLCGLFAALTALCSFITIPLGFTPIPLNLGTLAVFLSGGILGRKYATVSMVVYVLLGAAGLPVFAGFKGGLGALAGPTGGYIAGYIAAAFLIGWLIDLSSKRGAIFTSQKADAGKALGEFILCTTAMVLGLSVCCTLGTLWFMWSTQTDLWAALTVCVFPFLPGDALKIAVAAILVRKLRPFSGVMEVL